MATVPGLCNKCMHSVTAAASVHYFNAKHPPVSLPTLPGLGKRSRSLASIVEDRSAAVMSDTPRACVFLFFF